MQYVGQTSRALKLRFREHKYNAVKKTRNFLYQHFRKDGHNFNNVSVQPVECLTFDNEASNGFKTQARLIAEHKWIKNLQTPFPLVLMITSIKKVIFQKTQILIYSLFVLSEKENLDLMVLGKMVILNVKIAYI